MLIAALVGAGCADTARYIDDEYTVQAGDTLYSIAWRHDLDFHDLARWNGLGPDFRIHIGERLLLRPSAGERHAHVAPVPKADARGAQQGAPALRPPPAARAPPPPPPSPLLTALNWGWPTAQSAPPIAVPSGGVLLSGRVGQDNRAAAAGRVVYNGDGIRGYGNLIIIKHSDAVLSAYAHNRDSQVREGQQVTRGQVIGHMGEGAPGKPVLYFEIRLNGKPVDPLPILNAIAPYKISVKPATLRRLAAARPPTH